MYLFKIFKLMRTSNKNKLVFSTYGQRLRKRLNLRLYLYKQTRLFNVYRMFD